MQETQQSQERDNTRSSFPGLDVGPCKEITVIYFTAQKDAPVAHLLLAFSGFPCSVLCQMCATS